MCWINAILGVKSISPLKQNKNKTKKDRKSNCLHAVLPNQHLVCQSNFHPRDCFPALCALSSNWPVNSLVTRAMFPQRAPLQPGQGAGEVLQDQL